MGAGRQEHRVRLAGGLVGRGGTPTAGSVVRDSRGRARAPGATVDQGARRRRPARRVAGHAFRRQPVVGAGFERDHLLGVDEARLHGSVLHKNLRGAFDRRHAASRRRSPGHEHEAASLARRHAGRVHLHRRQARDHGVPQPERRAAPLRRAGHASHLRARRCVGERVRVVRRQQVDLPASERRYLRPRRAHVRAGDRPVERRGRPRRARRRGPDRELRVEPHRRRQAARLPQRREPDDGRCLRDRSGNEAHGEAHGHESRAGQPRARRSQARQVALVGRLRDLGPAAHAARCGAGRQAPARRLLPRRARAAA